MMRFKPVVTKMSLNTEVKQNHQLLLEVSDYLEFDVRIKRHDSHIECSSPCVKFFTETSLIEMKQVVRDKHVFEWRDRKQ